ncbi:MAG: glycoside hydrolase family 127 protein [Anaerolineae bacterium]|nr:glycoside hydrolase family 127 protein [Anaerolineae bacterium]
MHMKLNAPKFYTLPLGAIRPEGWLARQLRIQADGISGHLDEFWPDIRNSQWFGGDAEAWERAPYWLDGIIPLAFVLDDAPSGNGVQLKDKVTRYMDYILEHQHADGWLGPREMVAAGGRPVKETYDLWAQLLATKVLIQYYDATGDARAHVALEKNLQMLDRHIDQGPLFNWGHSRWFEVLIALYWLYERTGGEWLLDLASKVHAQGFDWGSFFGGERLRWPMAGPTPKGRWNYMSHVVNNAMAPKAHALWWRMTGDERDRAAVYDIISKLDRYHGMVTGMFTGDECLAGKRPTQGTELCAVVEYAFSLEVLLSIFGDPAFGDRLERIIFNALPATFSPDMWAHQYDQQVNQVECSSRDGWPWNTNGVESNIFGVEPNYGCCTANLSQGWPKFVAHLWMRPQSGGLAAMAYAPNTVSIEVDGVPVVVSLKTDYPFRESLHFTVTAEQPVTFPLLLRIPAWSPGAMVKVAGEQGQQTKAGKFHHVRREWEGTTEVLLTLPMSPTLWRGYNDAVAVERGPLVYALRMGEDWRRVHEDADYRELPHADWEVYPTTSWNYALDVDTATLEEDVTFIEYPVGECPFSPEGAPITATVKGRRLLDWQQDHGSAADAPQSPVVSSEPLEELTLIPYGCTNLRITEFPVLKQ